MLFGLRLGYLVLKHYNYQWYDHIEMHKPEICAVKTNFSPLRMMDKILE